MLCLIYMQKNHSNLISNLRAMNEPLSTVTELPASAAESSEDSKEEVPVLPRSRKKGTVELNPPNIHIEPPPPSSKVEYLDAIYENYLGKIFPSSINR